MLNIPKDLEHKMNLEADDFLVKRHQKRIDSEFENILKMLGLPYRTPFEQAAYDLQHTPKNRTSGPNLGEPLSINETTKDKQYIFIAACLTLFIVMLILV